MTTEQLSTALSHSTLVRHREFLLKHARPAIDIVRIGEAPKPASSRFGGLPDLPAGTNWPMHRLGPYRFLGQFNFAHIPTAGTGLPASGLLALFFAWDETGNIFWQEPDFIIGKYLPTIRGLVPTPPPAAADMGATTAIAFEPTVDLPEHMWWDNSWPIEKKEGDDYSELRRLLHPRLNFANGYEYLLGHPSFSSLAYDPSPGPEWISLFTAYSDEKLQWHWHDFDWLMVFIERDRLASCDFSALRADAG